MSKNWKISFQLCRQLGSVLVGGGAKRVNIVNFLWQLDSISIKGTYPGYKNKKQKKKKTRFNPPHLT